MIGCLAEAASTTIRKDDEEMSDVRWFDRQEVLLALEEKSERLTVPVPSPSPTTSSRPGPLASGSEPVPAGSAGKNARMMTHGREKR